MEGMENDEQGTDLDNSSSNVAEIMNFDAYAGWADQIFPSLVLSPVSTLCTNSPPFDGLNFTDLYSGISMVNGDIMGNLCSSEDKLVFSQLDDLLPIPTNSADLIETRNKSSSQHYVAGDIGNSVIPRPPKQSLAEKMLRALHLLKGWLGEGFLAQVWVPMKSGDRYILSTSEQPYLLDQTLSGYREVSRSFTFAAEPKPGSFHGLPGRVFTSRIPEWTSNVMYYNKAEYLRIQYAVDHEVRGSIALPVFEDDSLERSCCAVLELVTVKVKPNFDLEMENVCRALEAVNLCSKVPPRLSPQSLSRNQRAALAEITDILRAVCHAHRLPLALTWIPCSYSEGAGDETRSIHSRGYNTSLNEKYVLCIEDSACYVNDKDMQSFVHACAEHYLEVGQGVVGKALQSNLPFFYPDVKEYHVSDYPLVHHARKFGLNAAVAIRLRSSFTNDDDYILEFFLPVIMKGSAEQQLLLNNLSITMQRICKSLRTVSDAELLRLEDSKVELQGNEVKTIPTVALSRRSSELSLVDRDSTYVYRSTENASESTVTGVQANCSHEQPNAGSRKQMEKKRSTGEKHVSLSVLQKYFSGSLKDAAKSIGVCPTTLKRICRQHGISRWPSRKINKVNRSLRKIQCVLDSVAGMEGGLKFDPTTGSIIQDFGPRKNISISDADIVIQNAKSTPVLSSTGVETTVKVEEGCYRQVFDCSMKHEAFESLFVSRSSSSIAAVDEMETKSKDDSVMDKVDGDVEHNQPTSSGTTGSSNGSGSMMNGSSSSSKSFGERENGETKGSYGDSGSKITVKATYKEDTIRFRFEPAAGCMQLYEEVAKRFDLQIRQFQLKYVDDEDEWVMLVTDSDLLECLEIFDFMGKRSVKFMVRDVSNNVGSSSGSNSFLGEISL